MIRFLDESVLDSDLRVRIAVFASVICPDVSHRGNEMESWGKFTTYGGGGFWYNPGAQDRNWVFARWQAQYDFSDAVTLGGELCYHSADKIDAESGAGFSVGGFITLNESSHLLLSVGRSLFGESVVTGYVGFQYAV